MRGCSLEGPSTEHDHPYDMVIETVNKDASLHADVDGASKRDGEGGGLYSLDPHL